MFNPTYLHLDIQQHDQALLGLILDGHLAGSISVPSKLGVLNEPIFGDQILKVLHLDVMVINAIGLPRSRTPGRVRNRESKNFGVTLEEHLIKSALANARRAGEDNWAVIWWCCMRSAVSFEIFSMDSRAMSHLRLAIVEKGLVDIDDLEAVRLRTNSCDVLGMMRGGIGCRLKQVAAPQF